MIACVIKAEVLLGLCFRINRVRRGSMSNDNEYKLITSKVFHLNEQKLCHFT